MIDQILERRYPPNCRSYHLSQITIRSSDYSHIDIARNGGTYSPNVMILQNVNSRLFDQPH